MKFYKFWALLGCALLVISCFLPWAYYPDLNKVFTGFFSEKNMYGKPGKVFIFFTVIYAVFVLVNKVWAKRVNVFIAAITIAFLIKTWVLYLSCYGGICPEKRYGIFLLTAGVIIMSVTAVMPDTKVNPGSLTHNDAE